MHVHVSYGFVAGNHYALNGHKLSHYSRKRPADAEVGGGKEEVEGGLGHSDGSRTGSSGGGGGGAARFDAGAVREEGGIEVAGDGGVSGGGGGSGGSGGMGGELGGDAAALGAGELEFEPEGEEPATEDEAVAALLADLEDALDGGGGDAGEDACSDDPDESDGDEGAAAAPAALPLAAAAPLQLPPTACNSLKDLFDRRVHRARLLALLAKQKAAQTLDVMTFANDFSLTRDLMEAARKMRLGAKIGGRRAKLPRCSEVDPLCTLEVPLARGFHGHALLLERPPRRDKRCKDWTLMRATVKGRGSKEAACLAGGAPAAAAAGGAAGDALAAYLFSDEDIGQAFLTSRLSLLTTMASTT